MFEKDNHCEDMKRFFDDIDLTKLFGVEFNEVMIEKYARSKAEAIAFMRELGPHIPIIEIRPCLDKLFGSSNGNKSED